MPRVAWVLGGIVWLFLVFFVAFRLTFPSDAVSERIGYEVDQATHGQLALDIGQISPWWVGLKAKDVTLVQPGGDKPQTLLSVDSARVRVSPFSLLSDPHAVAYMRLGSGRVSVDTTVARTAHGYAPLHLDAQADAFPISAIPPIEGTQVKGKGTLDLDASISAPEGLSKAEGTLRLNGHGVVVQDLTGLGALLASSGVLPLSFDDLDLRIEFTQGKGRVVHGSIASSLATVDVGGDMILDDMLQRSRLHLTLTLTLGDAAGPFAGFLSGAKWSDDKYHYLLRGTLERPRLEPDRERIRRRPIGLGAPARQPQVAAPEAPPAPETLDAVRAAREHRMQSSPTRPTVQLRETPRGMPAMRTRPGAPEVGQEPGASEGGYPDEQSYDGPPPDEGAGPDEGAAPDNGAGPDNGAPPDDGSMQSDQGQPDQGQPDLGPPN